MPVASIYQLQASPAQGTLIWHVFSFLSWYSNLSQYFLPDDERQEPLLAVDIDEDDVGDIKFRIRNLIKASDAGASILYGINMDIPRGVIVGIIGPSGSGKSTVLRALNRLWEPPSGTVFLDGRDIRDLDVLTLRRKVGMLFQLPALFEG